MATTNIQKPLLTLRPAQVEDAAQVASLGTDIFTKTFGHSVKPEQMQQYLDECYSLEATIQDIRDPTKDMILATVTSAEQANGTEVNHVSSSKNNKADTIIGFALLTRGTTEPCLSHIENQDETLIELQRIYVHRDHHGQGVGKVLALRAEQMARNMGFRYMWLGVWEENVKAQKVYEKLDYKEVGDHVFVLGGDPQRDLVMIKEL